MKTKLNTLGAATLIALSIAAPVSANQGEENATTVKPATAMQTAATTIEERRAARRAHAEKQESNLTRSERLWRHWARQSGFN